MQLIERIRNEEVLNRIRESQIKQIINKEKKTVYESTTVEP